MDAGFRFDVVVYSPKLIPSPTVEIQLRRLRRDGVPTLRVAPEDFRKISTAPRASGVAALVRERWRPPGEVDPQAGLCLLAIESLRSAGNLGTILRTAEACGVGGVFFTDDGWDPYEPDVVRASMGGMFHLPLARTDGAELARWCRERGVALVGLSPEATQLWTDLPRDRPTCLVIGEERQGISASLNGRCDMHVRLPMAGTADSLNVAVATGIALYEFMRRALHAKGMTPRKRCTTRGSRQVP
ncbi:MAG: RNA methyltransferase [Pirellulales bacterium]